MRKGLGRGIESLFSDTPSAVEDKPDKTLKLTDIEPNKNQPRRDFDKEKISELASSIKEYGLIQPIVVTKNKSGRFVIVAGERRWRAAKEAGLKEVPVIIKDYTDEQVAEIALIENLQREDLNPIEEALGYRTLLEDFNLTQEAISGKLGKSRSAIANSLRLLSLEDDIKKYIVSGEISSGHARAILSLDEKTKRVELTNRIIAEQLNVRQAENLAKQMQKNVKARSKKTISSYDIEMESLCEKLSSKFGTKVSFNKTSKKSKIEIEYYNDSDLERILEILDV